MKWVGDLKPLAGEVCPERQIVVYVHDQPAHPDGFRTFTVLQADTGVITDQWNYRLSA